MHSFSIAAAAASLLALAAASPVERVAAPIEERATQCHSAPFVIYAVGTNPTAASLSKPYPTFTDSIMTTIAQDAIPNAVISSLPYPAAGIADSAQYDTSWFDGTKALQNMIMNYVDSCQGKNPRVVVMGYSQGASVVTAAIGGFHLSCTDCTTLKPLASKYTNAIKGGVLFADPSYDIGLTHLDYIKSNDPNTMTDGSFQNGNAQQTVNKVLGNVIRSYCEAGDEFCANAGPSGQGIHEQEETHWQSIATSFLKGLNL